MGIVVFQIAAERAIVIWNIGVLVLLVVTMEVGEGLAEAPAVLVAKSIPVPELLIASVSVAVIEHRVYIYVEPVCPHCCHGALEFLPCAPVRPPIGSRYANSTLRRKYIV